MHTITIRRGLRSRDRNRPVRCRTGQHAGIRLHLTNATPADYTDVNLGVMAHGSTPGCDTTPFPALQWSDGGVWQTLSLANLSLSAGTISVSAGQRIEIRVKLNVPATLPGCLTRGQVSVQVWLPGGGSAVAGPSLDSPPGFFVRGDSPFFSIS
jgi:hypothetical protein